MGEPTVEIIREIADELGGTCRSLDTALEERGFDIGNVPSVLLEALDAEVMLCETCGWWCDSDEIDDDGNCNDCRKDEDEISP